jgi:hypothetical protein
MSKINTSNVLVANKARNDLNKVYGHALAALVDVVGEYGIDFTATLPAAEDATSILPDMIANAEYIASRLHTKKDEYRVIRPELLDNPANTIDSILLVIATTSCKTQIDGKKLLPVIDAIEQQIQLTLELLVDTIELAEAQGNAVAASSVFTKHFGVIADTIDAYCDIPRTSTR